MMNERILRDPFLLERLSAEVQETAGGLTGFFRTDTDEFCGSPDWVKKFSQKLTQTANITSMTTSTDILCYAVRHQGDWSRIAQAIHSHEPVEPVISRSPWVTFLDPDYPACFRKLRYPPWILFYPGDLSLLDRPCAAVVGSRDATMQALRNTTAVVNALKERYVIVSGLARGVDAQAHRAALDKGTVGILGCGIDRVYPRENAALFSAMKKNHLVISEYPWQTTPLPGHFPWRNRLIAAAASVVVVTEAREKSGTMYTVDEALSLSVPVWCLPTDFSRKDHCGCNRLIHQGAGILCDLQQVREL